jgi:translocation and assembly module TamB
VKLRRIFRVGLWFVSFVVLALVATAGWIYATQSGARFAVARVVGASGGALAVDSIDGRLRDELVLSGIRYRDARVEVDIERLTLRLGLSSLLARMLVIEDIASTTVVVRWLGNPPGEPAEDGAALRLPGTVRLDRATISGLAIETGDDRLDLERITLTGIVEESDAYVSRLELRALGFFLSLQGSVSWADGLALDGLVSWDGRLGETQWLGRSDFIGVWPVLEIEQEMLEPFAQTARGRLLLDPMPAADLIVNWRGLGELELTAELDPEALEVQGAVRGENLSLAALVAGWPGELALSASLLARFGEVTRIETDDLHAEASLGDDAIVLDLAGAFTAPGTVSIERLVASQGQNRVVVAGTAGDALDLAIGIALDDISGLAALAARDEIAGLGLARWVPEGLSGRGAADLALTGTRDSPALAGTLTLEDSTFGGLPFALGANFAASSPGSPGIRLQSFEAALGASRMTAAGTLANIARLPDGGFDADLDLVVQVGLADLAEIATLAGREDVQALLGRALPLTTLSGSALANLRIGGSLTRPDLALELSATEPGYRNVALEEASLGASGRIDASGWDGTLESLRLADSRFGAWTLAAPVPMRIGPGRAEIPEACLVQATSSICGEYRVGDSDDALRIFAEDLDLALLAPFVPAGLTFSGHLDLDASIASPSSRPQGRIAVRGEDIDVVIGASDTDPIAMTLQSVAVDAELDDPALSLNATIEALAGGRAVLTMSSPDLRAGDGPIRAHLDAYWPDLSGLALLSPDVGDVEGQLSIAIDVAGTAGSPIVSGSAVLDEAMFTVPQWGLVVDRIGASATSPDGETLEFNGRGFIADREVALTGTTGLDPAAGWPTRLAVRGDRLPVARRADAQVFASPDLMVDVALPRIDVRGEVLIPEALIAFEDLPPQAVRVSPDAVVHGQAAVEQSRPLDVTADLTIELGDDVRYEAANLDTNLTGTLRLEYRSGFSPEASGNIRMEGDYDAYGQSLVLERGELLFAGPLNNPALDVLAVRRIGARPGVQADVVVGIRLSGTLLAPVPTVYSDPAMSEANALSYLRFGRPLTASDGTETATLESMALSLGLQQALPAVQRVGESIGLDELTIATTELDAGSLMAGKYLSPKVYMSYTYGLFNRLGGFLLRYDINDRFSLETRSGDEKSMDLLYSTEKD